MDQQANGGAAQRRSYTEDYKRQVVDLVMGSGRTPTAVAGEVGLHPTVLCRWVRQHGSGAGAAKAEAPRPAAAPFLQARAGFHGRPGCRDRTAQARVRPAPHGARHSSRDR